MRGTVVEIDEETKALTVETQASGPRQLPGPYVAEHLEHAYALTGHGMQGGTVEWAGVVGRPEDFTANWSYTALSRAREPCEVYVVADEERFERERSEVAPQEPEREPPLRRMAQAMRTRDDEDLVLDWAEPPQLPAPTPARSTVADLQRELAELEVRLAGLPREQARALEAARAQRIEAERRVVEARERVAALERKWLPDRAALAQERTHLGYEEHALEGALAKEADLARRAPEIRQVEAETTELGAQRDRLRDELDRRREAHVREALGSPGAHLESALGARPDDWIKRETWERAAKAIERYRFDHEVSGAGPLGTRPIEREAQLAHRRAEREIEVATRLLGRTVERGRSIGLEP